MSHLLLFDIAHIYFSLMFFLLNFIVNFEGGSTSAVTTSAPGETQVGCYLTVFNTMEHYCWHFELIFQTGRVFSSLLIYLAGPCAPDTCPPDSTCQVLKNSYTCLCRPGLFYYEELAACGQGLLELNIFVISLKSA